MQIKKFEGSPSEFYALMGKFFAESKYKKEMPYLVNRETNIWFIALSEMQQIGVVAFGAINELKDKIVFEHSYVEENYRKSGLWKQINEQRFQYVMNSNKCIEVIMKEEYLKTYWIEKGFEVFKQNGRYFYLRRKQEC